VFRFRSTDCTRKAPSVLKSWPSPFIPTSAGSLPESSISKPSTITSQNSPACCTGTVSRSWIGISRLRSEGQAAIPTVVTSGRARLEAKRGKSSKRSKAILKFSLKASSFLQHPLLLRKVRSSRSGALQTPKIDHLCHDGSRGRDAARNDQPFPFPRGQRARRKGMVCDRWFEQTLPGTPRKQSRGQCPPGKMDRSSGPAGLRKRATATSTSDFISMMVPSPRPLKRALKAAAGKASNLYIIPVCIPV